MEATTNREERQDGPARANDPQTRSRRQFLQVAVRTAGVGGLTLTLLPRLPRAAGEDGEADRGGSAPDADVQYGFLVDTTRCIGCTRCVESCVEENEVPAGFLRTWVERYTYFEDGTVRVDGHSEEPPYAYPELSEEDKKRITKSFFVPKLCNHCENTPCVQVCPVHASYISPEGVVLVDPNQCVGCSYCVQACPFGTRFINPRTNAADKCTWCYHRVRRGLDPACVEACPTEARMFGNIADPNSPIRKRMDAARIDVLKSYLGTAPRTRYIGLTAEVV